MRILQGIVRQSPGVKTDSKARCKISAIYQRTEFLEEQSCAHCKISHLREFQEVKQLLVVLLLKQSVPAAPESRTLGCTQIWSLDTGTSVFIWWAVDRMNFLSAVSVIAPAYLESTRS